MEENIKKYGWKDAANARLKTLKWKAQCASEKVKNSVKNWCAANPEAVAGIVVAAAGAGIKIAKTSARTRKVKQEQYWKDTHIYDHSLGRYVELRRKLKSDEYARILDRKETTGKSLSVVLDEMGFLK